MGDSHERGAIFQSARAKQLHDFQSLRYGTITPTDVDLLIDWHGEAFVFAEIKLVGNAMPRGQELALMRVVDGLTAAGRRAVLFEVEHREFDARRQVDAAHARVRRTYYRGRWRQDHQGLTLRQGCDRFFGLPELAESVEAETQVDAADLQSKIQW